MLLGAAPFLGYLTTRTIGLPGDAEDVGWNDWGGTMSLVVEAALVVLALSVLLNASNRTRSAKTRPLILAGV